MTAGRDVQAFVLVLVVPYEGEILLGVYSSRGKAIAAAKAFPVEGSDEAAIFAVPIDSPAAYRFAGRDDLAVDELKDRSWQAVRGRRRGKDQ